MEIDVKEWGDRRWLAFHRESELSNLSWRDETAVLVDLIRVVAADERAKAEQPPADAEADVPETNSAKYGAIEVRAPGNSLDEVVLTQNGVHFHLEQMSDGCWWMCIQDADGNRVAVSLWGTGKTIICNMSGEPQHEVVARAEFDGNVKVKSTPAEATADVPEWVAVRVGSESKQEPIAYFSRVDQATQWVDKTYPQHESRCTVRPTYILTPKELTARVEAATADLQKQLDNVTHDRDTYKKLFDEAIEHVDQAFQTRSNGPPPILPNFCGLGDCKFAAVPKLAKAYVDLQKQLADRDAEQSDIDRMVPSEFLGESLFDRIQAVVSRWRDLVAATTAADAKLADREAEIERLKNRLAPSGGCRILSIGDKCDCTLCRKDRAIDKLTVELAEARKPVDGLRTGPAATFNREMHVVFYDDFQRERAARLEAERREAELREAHRKFSVYAAWDSLSGEWTFRSSRWDHWPCKNDPNDAVIAAYRKSKADNDSKT